MKKLTAKEKLFCITYCEVRNGREAAARAGYVMPQRTAAKLLERDCIREEITRLSSSRAVDLSEVCAGYRRLAFGSPADALKLLLNNEGIPDDAALEELDLFNVAEIKRPRGDALEIKFFDRLKALEHLEAIGTDSVASAASQPFFEALEQSTRAIKKS